MEHEITGIRITCIRPDGEDTRSIVLRIEIACEDRTVRGLSRPDGVEEMPTIRQEVRPEMAVLGIKVGNCFGFTTFCRHAIDTLWRTEQNYSVTVPSAS